MIHCSNSLCQAPNALDRSHCDRCGQPLVKCYLWAVGKWVNSYQIGEILEDRFLLQAPRILLDLHPELADYSPQDIPSSILPYLKLFPYRRHVPQVHSYIPSRDERMNLEICLLEYGSLPLDEQGQLRYPNLLPAIADCWSQASARQQLQWLWQIAQLWEPLQQQRVVSSLLDPNLLRINGTAVQLLELKLDGSAQIELQQLGEVWSSWLEGLDPVIVPFLQALCHDLRSQAIARPQTLLRYLEAGIDEILAVYSQRYRLFTATDVGRSREHNEDACYPPPESLVELTSRGETKESTGNNPFFTPFFTIVCDGVGGQDGGEIAANLTIETLQAAIADHLQSPAWKTQSSRDLQRFLEQAILAANEQIYQRNNAEDRQDLRRMGTTLVLSLFCKGKAYFAHTGDSRLYWITPSSCQQVTVDDDWASKEVRMGYSLYRDVVQYPKAGSLVQAIGISESSLLTPTVQLSILDENCVILLCSDGLSDFNRVEQYGLSLIAPILAGTVDVATVGHQLIALANELNGHDNVTLALIHCQSGLPADQSLPILDYDRISEKMKTPLPPDYATPPFFLTPDPSLEKITPPSPRSRLWIWAIAFGLLIIASVGLPRLFTLDSSGVQPEVQPSPEASPEPSPAINP